MLLHVCTGRPVRVKHGTVT